MLEIILDTETTGLSTTENHRIVEIGCIELNNLIPTKKIFHEYINPERPVSTEAYKIHGYSDKFLSDKKLFSQIVDDFLEFIKDKRIIIHNANFDLSFLNYELAKIKREKIEKENIIDTLEIARQKYPGSQNSLDALCKRYNIDNSRREKHTALIDCQLLQEVYVNLIDQKEPKLNLENVVSQYKDNYKQQKNKLRKIIKISSKESELHREYLKNNLKNNYFN